MQELSYIVSFTTPAFLGNAEQQAQWRTPPFKALLRQWWRVAAASQFNYNHQQLREAEGRLFGHAWLENDRDEKGKKVAARKSLITMRLEPWDIGKQHSSDWPGGRMDEVITTKDGKGRVRADVYLGFGAVLPPSKKEGRNSIELRGMAIKSGEQATFRLRTPDEHKDSIQSALILAHLFGALGSRSRNGWGSLSLSNAALDIATLEPYARPLTSCLKLDWPHALGKDTTGLLIWVTEAKQDWRAVMSALAHIKIGIRIEAKKYRDRGGIGGAHLLGYPAGKTWTLREFSKGIPNRDDQEARLAAQVRFKVLQTPQGLVGIVYHLPAKLPDALMARLNPSQRAWVDANELKIWQSIHRYLDNNSKIQRAGDAK